MTTEELLRFAFTQSSNQTIVGQTVFQGWAARPGGPGPDVPEMLTTTVGELPGAADPGRATRLPFGTVDLLEATPFPSRPARGPADGPDRLGHALVAAFGPQRREPANLFNDHRGFPSVRSKFPVHVFVTRDGRHRWLDVYRHALLDMGAPARRADEDRILLAARYSHLPALYGEIRGPLTELELGINLRALCVALDLFGVRYRVDLPGGASESYLRELGLDPVWDWTLPAAVRPYAGSPPAPPPALPAPPPAPPAPRAQPDDPVLREVVATNRTAMLRPADEQVPLPPSIPPSIPSAGSWADALWARSSGTMPRQMKGLAGRRLVRPFSVVEHAMDWLAAPPPSALMREIRRMLVVTVCLQDIEGHPSGVYRLADDGLRLVTRNDLIASELERGYGHYQARDVGCGVRVANATWFVTVRARQLVGELGPWAWPLALLTSGWMTQGLCLAAAADGMYARPARAFQEIPAERLLGLAPGEILLISVTCGTPRFCESTLDLRL